MSRFSWNLRVAVPHSNMLKLFCSKQTQGGRTIMPLYQNIDVDAPQFSQDVVGEALKKSLSSLGSGDESLSSVMESAKEGLLNLCTNVGLKLSIK